MRFGRALFNFFFIPFVVLEIFLLVVLGKVMGWFLLFYLIMMAFYGVRLIKQQAQSLKFNVMLGLQDGMFSQGIPSEFNGILAGILFVFPGVISDIFGFALLIKILFGLRNKRTQRAKHKEEQSADKISSTIVEGEFTVIEKDKKSLDGKEQ